MDGKKLGEGPGTVFNAARIWQIKAVVFLNNYFNIYKSSDCRNKTCLLRERWGEGESPHKHERETNITPRDQT